MSEPKDQEISQDAIRAIDAFCKKSKKHCALCDEKLGPPSKEQLKHHTGRIWCSWVSLRHPKWKSKSYKLCGQCYGAILRKQEAHADPA